MSELLQPSLFPRNELKQLTTLYNAVQKKKRQELVTELRRELDLVHFDEPKTDNDVMLNLQYEYLRNGSEEAKAQLWSMAYKMASNILHGYLARKKLHISEDEKDEKIGLAVIDVMKRYEKIYYRGNKEQREARLYPYVYSVKNYVLQFQLAIKKTFGYVPHLEFELVRLEDIEAQENTEE